MTTNKMVHVNGYWVYTKNSDGLLERFPHCQTGRCDDTVMLHDDLSLCVDYQTEKNKSSLGLSVDGVLFRDITPEVDGIAPHITESDIEEFFFTSDAIFIFRIDTSTDQACIFAGRSVDELYCVTFPFYVRNLYVIPMGTSRNYFYLCNGSTVYRVTYDDIIKASKNSWASLMDTQIEIKLNDSDSTLHWGFAVPCGDLVYDSDYNSYLIDQDGHGYECTPDRELNTPNKLNVMGYSLVIYLKDQNTTIGVAVSVAKLSRIDVCYSGVYFTNLALDLIFEDDINDVFMVGDVLYGETTKHLYEIARYDLNLKRFALTELVPVEVATVWEEEEQ